jgi:undecaprenyl-diphosphatase
MDIIINLDKFIFTWINTDWSNSFFDLIMPWITHLADSSIVWLWFFFFILLNIWKLVRSKEKKLSNKQQRPIIIKAVLHFCLYIALIYGINAGIYKSVKHLFNRPRPFIEDTVKLRVSPTISSNIRNDGSFPSDHASNAFMLAALFSVIILRKRIIFYGLAGLIALSRVYLGVHFPVDVIIGSGIGFTVTSLMLFLGARNKIILLKNIGQYTEQMASA